ncbi:proton-coupled amino acid transporter-like protein CG1139 isoform X3 [Homalodisca vitripennis]|uniref:proton-coupled amino acid transporter-like protein CG1139 isoform X3 n=1 Tax=Homalodisca vitripennis TaxID=197043 RepID=UPI001EEA3ED0|nr:proton-coupled amino acid transporter-like protein CG1139 isoform X3 [Homalodisca vitripennis]
MCFTMDKTMAHNVADNKAMVWESSDKLAADSRLNLGKVEDHRPPVVDLPTVESVSHMQRPKYPTTYIETLENHLKTNIASGMFAMGDAFKNAGLLLAPVLTMFLGCLCVFNQHILVNSANRMREQRKLNYYPNFNDTVDLCFDSGPPLFRKFAKHSRFAVNFFIIVAQLGFCCVYIVFVTSTSQQILHYFGYEIEIHLNMVITQVFITMTIFIRNLKYLAPVSLFATVTMVIGIALTLYLSSEDIPPITDRHAVASLHQLPLFFGTVVYAYEGIGAVLPLQSEMKNPEKFSTPLGVLNVGNLIVTVLLLSTGFIGYLKYGEAVEGSLTLNLPYESILSQFVKITIAIGMLLTYPIVMYVPHTIIWPAIVKRWGPFERKILYEYLVKLILCLITFVLAEVISNLSVFISLMGAVISTALALMFPSLCDL